MSELQAALAVTCSQVSPAVARVQCGWEMPGLGISREQVAQLQSVVLGEKPRSNRGNDRGLPAACGPVVSRHACNGGGMAFRVGSFTVAVGRSVTRSNIVQFR